MKNIDGSNFPVQKLPLSKKNQEWRERCVDAVIGREGGGLIAGLDRKDRMSIHYELYNGNYSEDDLKYVTNPFKVDDGFPATPQDFNIIRPKIDLLLGEETKRPFNFKVVQTNDEVVSEIQTASTNRLMEYIVDSIKDTIQEGETPEEIQKYFSMNYKTVAENTAHNGLNYLREKLNLTHEFLKGFKDGLIAGEELYYIGIVNGEPCLERVNPVECDYDKDPNLDFIEDGDWFLRHMRMSPGAIYDRFFDMMEEKDLDDILSAIEGRVTGGKQKSDVNSSGIMYKDKSFFSSLLSGKTDSREGVIDVWHAVWRSFKKVGFLTTNDEDGFEKTIMVSEEYKPDEDENIVWDWITEVWEGYRFGEDKYVGIQPVEYQYISLDNPNSAKLPYTGVQYSNTNSGGKSLVAIMKPLQYFYIVVLFRLELALARDKGKIITMDITQIPKSMGISVERWMHFLTSAGVNFVNPYEEGWDIPGREGGKPAQFNQIGQTDLTMSNVIAGYIELLNKLEEMIGELSGVSKQRQGAIEQRELVGNVQRAVIQSSHITEPLFWNHNQAKKRCLTSLLNTAKYAWENYNKRKLHYIMPDATRVFLDITDEFLFSDLDVFLSDSTKDQMNIETLRTLLQPAMQAGAGLLDMAEVLTTDNLTEIKLKLKEIEKKREQMQQQMAQQEQAMQEQQLAIEQQMADEQNRIKEEDSIRQSNTDIEVALIQAEASIKDDGSSGDDKDVKREKIAKDSEQRRRELDEKIRKNKADERQREKEIAIKRRQANKPVGKIK